MISSKGKNRLLIGWVLVLAFFGFCRMTTGTAVAADASCTDCHDDKQNAAFVHPPAQEGDCQACHEPEPSHLEEGGPGGMKTNRTASACYQCHDPKNVGKDVHPALEMEGECIQCHNPHGSDNEKFLIKPEDRLCFDCHDPVPQPTAGGSQHSVVTDRKSCLNCHDPHSSAHEALLLDGVRSLCLKCHDKDITVRQGEKTRTVKSIKERVLDMTYVHEPATGEDGCTACHTPHGSKFRSLLLASFPAKNYNRYEPGSDSAGNTFDLCFGCHDQSMLNETITGAETGFRNDTVRDGVVVRENLHWYHVVDAAGSAHKNRGRSCDICHDPHGSTNPHLIRTQWTMRSFNPPLVFENSADGGTCLKSCHSPKRYQRME